MGLRGRREIIEAVAYGFVENQLAALLGQLLDDDVRHQFEGLSWVDRQKIAESLAATLETSTLDFGDRW